MSTPFTLKAKLPLRRSGPRGRHEIGPEPGSNPAADQSRVPRVSRLMALAIHLDGLIRSGAIKDQAEIARVGRVSRARVTQIMGLLCLAPDIQEQLLFLERSDGRRAAVTLADLMPITGESNWLKQRKLWTIAIKKQHVPIT